MRKQLYDHEKNQQGCKNSENSNQVKGLFKRYLRELLYHLVIKTIVSGSEYERQNQKKIMKKHGHFWLLFASLAIFGKFWLLLATFCYYFCLHLATFGYFWLQLTSFGYFLLLFASFGYNLQFAPQ